MADVYDRFKHLFQRRTIALTNEDIEREKERREHDKAFVHAMREFTNNAAYKEFRERVNAKIISIRPKSELGLDGAAATAFRQEGLREALDVLDIMVLEAQEILDGLGTDDG